MIILLKELERKDYPLLGRTRAEFKLTFEGATPSRAEVRAAVAKAIGTADSLTVIRHIYTRFGSSEAKIVVHSYKSEEEMRTFEDRPTLLRHGIELEKKGRGDREAEGEKKQGRKE